MINGLAHDKSYIARLEEIAKQHEDAGTKLPTLVRTALSPKHVTYGLTLGAMQYVASAAGLSSAVLGNTVYCTVS
jgi:hypothetical protein